MYILLLIILCKNVGLNVKLNNKNNITNAYIYEEDYDVTIMHCIREILYAHTLFFKEIWNWVPKAFAKFIII